MSKFQIIDNIEVPQTVVTRNRPRGEFSLALDSLEVGQGFVFDDARDLKQVYPSIAPKKFPSDVAGMTKKFKIWQAAPGQVGVKRVEDAPVETRAARVAMPAQAVEAVEPAQAEIAVQDEATAE